MKGRCERQKGLVKWQALTLFFNVMVRFKICPLCLEPVLYTGEMGGKSDSICFRDLGGGHGKKGRIAISFSPFMQSFSCTSELPDVLTSFLCLPFFLSPRTVFNIWAIKLDSTTKCHTHHLSFCICQKLNTFQPCVFTHGKRS